MTDREMHLSEEQRHAFVDDELNVDERRTVAAHLEECQGCADDVRRLEQFVKHIQLTQLSIPPAAVDELWPSVRGRIEAAKVAQLSRQPSRARAAWRRSPWYIAAAVAAAIVAVVVPVAVRATRREAGSFVEQSATPPNGPVLSAVADSERLYQQEAQMLLNRLELERSMLRPETVRSVDHDLQVIDKAIAELKEAIARDPNNPALHQLLASSYRQKAELLKRVSNAG